jgi:protein O-mannosyl-transferase
VAALFAIHPLRVESVAWIAERKDVLSGLFFMLALGAYVRYTQRTRIQGAHSRGWYGLTLGLFALGLMAKGMLVTLPAVLLLLDYWPLQRGVGWRRLVREKIPFLALSAASCLATLLVPEVKAGGGSILPFSMRLADGLVSSVIYLRQMAWPRGLFIPCLYPLNGQPLAAVVAAVVLLLGGCVAAWRWRASYPYLLVGWGWYWLSLLPVMGFVQISYYSHADRYTYLPQIGLAMAVTWGVADLSAGWRYRKAVLGLAAALIVVSLAAAARMQAGYWRDSTSLWSHTLDCDPENPVAHNYLGLSLATQGKLDQAVPHWERALELNPDYAMAHNNLGFGYVKQGRVDAAAAEWKRALELNPSLVEAHNNLGYALATQGRFEEAIQHYRQAVLVRPDCAEAYNNWGNALAGEGRLDEAALRFKQTLQIRPDHLQAWCNLAGISARQGRLDEAAADYQRALNLALARSDSAAVEDIREQLKSCQAGK